MVTLTPNSPACILYAAMNPWVTPQEACDWFGFPIGSAEFKRYTAAAKAVRDAALNEAAMLASNIGTERWHGTQMEDACDEIYAAIRALKDKTP